MICNWTGDRFSHWSGNQSGDQFSDSFGNWSGDQFSHQSGNRFSDRSGNRSGNRSGDQFSHHDNHCYNLIFTRITSMIPSW